MTSQFRDVASILGLFTLGSVTFTPDPLSYRNLSRAEFSGKFLRNVNSFPTTQHYVNCALLGCYAASGGNFLPAFGVKMSGPSSKGQEPLSWTIEP
jgi:hypothetical protein